MQSLIGPFLVFFAALSWSTAGLFTRVVTTDIPTTLLWRSVIGGLCVLAFYYFHNRNKNGKAALRESMRLSTGEFVTALLSAAGMLCFISAFFYTTIANVALMYGASPLLVYVMSLVFLKARLAIAPVACCFATLAGVAIITYGNTGVDNYFGILLALCMTFFMAAMTVSAKFYPAADPVKVSYVSAFMVALVVLPFATHAVLPAADYIWLGLYGITNVGLGFAVYFVGVKRVTAFTASLIGLSEIPLAPVWAWLLFNERIGALVFIGGTIITATAVVYIVYSKGRTQ